MTEWVDCSVVGSMYECQFDMNSEPMVYRHRSRAPVRATTDQEGRGWNDIWAGDMIEDSWHPGLAPDCMEWTQL